MIDAWWQEWQGSLLVAGDNYQEYIWEVKQSEAESAEKICC